LYDTHMHTRFSTDSTMSMEDAVRRAGELGLGIIITEHMDLNYPEPQAFIFNVDEYFDAYQPCRNDNVLLGIEIGMRGETEPDNRRIVEGHSFDYVIGSIHIVDGVDIYQESFYQGRTKQDVYSRYFSAMLDCVTKYDWIDSLGHIDYIARYARFQDVDIYLDEFREPLEKILGLLASRNKAMEINTRRLGDKKALEALIPIYRRFKELGGQFVTIGSDAHNPKDIGKNFEQAMSLAQICNLKPVFFRERRMEYWKEGV